MAYKRRSAENCNRRRMQADILRLISRMRGMILLVSRDVVPTFTEAMERENVLEALAAMRYWTHREGEVRGIGVSLRIMFGKIWELREFGDLGMLSAYLERVVAVLTPRLLHDPNYTLGPSELPEPLTGNQPSTDEVEALVMIRYMVFMIHGLIRSWAVQLPRWAAKATTK